MKSSGCSNRSPAAAAAATYHHPNHHDHRYSWRCHNNTNSNNNHNHNKKKIVSMTVRIFVIVCAFVNIYYLPNILLPSATTTINLQQASGGTGAGGHGDDDPPSSYYYGTERRRRRVGATTSATASKLIITHHHDKEETTPTTTTTTSHQEGEEQEEEGSTSSNNNNQRMCSESQQDNENDISATTATTTTTSGAATTTNTTKSVRFLFFIGLEGTGHHFVHKIWSKSPVTWLLKNPNQLNLESKMLQLNKALYNRYQKSGLMDSYYYNNTKSGANAVNSNTTINSEDSDSDDDSESNDGSSSPPFFNYTIAEKINAVSKILQDIVQKVHNSTSTSTTNQLDIAINANGIKGVKMMSYPKGIRSKGKYPGLPRTPSLELLYQACTQAQVTCEHVYIYRDLYSIIYSTTIKRQFNSNIYTAIHLYKTMLLIIREELMAFPYQTTGCYNFLDDHTGGGDGDNNKQELLWDPIRKLSGWESIRIANSNNQTFEEYINSVYVPVPSLSPSQKQQFIPDEYYGPQMKSLVKIHNDVIHLCQQQVARNNKKKILENEKKKQIIC